MLLDAGFLLAFGIGEGSGPGSQLRRMVAASQVALAVVIGPQPTRNRRPLFNIDPEIGSLATDIASSGRERVA